MTLVRTYAVGFFMLPHPAIYFSDCILPIIRYFLSESFPPDELPENVLVPQQIGYPTAGRSTPESRPRTPDQDKGLFIYFLQKKDMQDKKNTHASERSETESKPKVCERFFPLHLSKSQRLLRRLTSFQLVDFSRDGAILRRRSPNRHSLFEVARKSSICTHQPKQNPRTQEKCDLC